MSKLTLQWSRGGVGVDASHPISFPCFFLYNEKRFFQIKFLAVGSSLGHLSMKNFPIGPTVLALKLEKGRVLGDGNHPPIEQKLTYISNHEDDIQSQQILA